MQALQNSPKFKKYFSHPIRIPLGGDDAVLHVQPAHACGSCLGKILARAACVVAAVVDGVILSLVFDHAVVPRALFKVVFDHDGVKCTVFCVGAC